MLGNISLLHVAEEPISKLCCLLLIYFLGGEAGLGGAKACLKSLSTELYSLEL